MRLNGPQSKITVILDTFRERTPRGKPREDRKRLEWCCHKPKDATDHWPRPELKRGREGLSPSAVVPNLFGTRDRFYGASEVAQMVKNRLAMQETRVWSLGQEDTLEKRMKTHFSVLDWKIPCTEEPGGLQSMAGGKRVRHKWVTKHQQYIHKFQSIFYSTLLPTYMIDWSPQMDNRSKSNYRNQG